MSEPTFSEVGAGDWIAGLGILLFFFSILLLLSGNKVQYGVWLLPISVTAMIAGGAIMAYEKSQRNRSTMRPYPQQTSYYQPQYQQPPPPRAEYPQQPPQDAPPGGYPPQRNNVPPPPVKTDIEERLSNLSELKEKGLITDEEYQAKKEEILKKL